jgi:DNA-binding PadR family transcriptional regulator
MTEPDELESLLPLSQPVFHILLALADRQRHGYAIMKAIARATDARVQLSTGTLYAAIKRLLADGLIEESDQRPEDELDDERRRYYRLTPAGRELARLESERVAGLTLLARRKKLLAGNGGEGR